MSYRETTEEQKLESYSDPDTLIGILSRGDEIPVVLCTTGLCKHYGTARCPHKKDKMPNITHCDEFTLGAETATEAEALIINAMTAEQHNAT